MKSIIERYGTVLSLTILPVLIPPIGHQSGDSVLSLHLRVQFLLDRRLERFRLRNQCRLLGITVGIGYCSVINRSVGGYDKSCRELLGYALRWICHIISGTLMGRDSLSSADVLCSLTEEYCNSYRMSVYLPSIAANL